MLAWANAVYHGEFPLAACLKSLVWFDAPALDDLDSEDRHLLESSALGIEEIPAVGVQNFLIGEK